MQQEQRWQQIEQEKQEAELNKQLDATLNQMHTVRPDIPEQFLIQGIAAGNDPKSIVELYDQITKNVGSQRPPRTPPVVMGGQGGVPSGQVDVSKLNKEQRLAYMAQMLEASQQ